VADISRPKPQEVKDTIEEGEDKYSFRCELTGSFCDLQASRADSSLYLQANSYCSLLRDSKEG
jgi:hypothetical protein